MSTVWHLCKLNLTGSFVYKYLFREVGVILGSQQLRAVLQWNWEICSEVKLFLMKRIKKWICCMWLLKWISPSLSRRVWSAEWELRIHFNKCSYFFSAWNEVLVSDASWGELLSCLHSGFLFLCDNWYFEFGFENSSHLNILRKKIELSVAPPGLITCWPNANPQAEIKIKSNFQRSWSTS